MEDQSTRTIPDDYRTERIEDGGDAIGERILEDALKGWEFMFEDPPNCVVDDDYIAPQPFDAELGQGYATTHPKKRYYRSYCPFCEYPAIEKPKYFIVNEIAHSRAKGSEYHRIVVTECPDCHHFVYFYQKKKWRPRKSRQKSPSAVSDKGT